MFQTGRIAARPQGMNSGNNMAFLQKAQSGYGGGFNPFAQATPSRPSMPQGFGAGMYATPSQRSPMPFGGQFGQQDMGAILQQFSQMGGMFGGGGMKPLPFQGNQQQMAAAQQFAPQNPMAARMAQMQGQMPAGPRQMATQLSEAEGRAASAAAQQRMLAGGGRQQMAAQQQFAAPNPMQARMAQMQGQMPAAPRQMAAQLSEADGRAAAAAAQQRRFGGGGRA